MIQSIQREASVETLLNTLEAEHYVRGPLLATIVDELTAVECLEPAAEVARAILEGLESGQLREADFAPSVSALRNLVHRLSVSASRAPPAPAMPAAAPTG